MLKIDNFFDDKIITIDAVNDFFTLTKQAAKPEIGKNDDGSVSAIRYVVNSIVAKFIKQKLSSLFPDIKGEKTFISYQDQYSPALLHIDNYGLSDPEAENNYTMIILLSSSDDKLIVLNELLDHNDDFEKLSSRPRINNLSSEYDLSHTINDPGNTSLADNCDLDGVFDFVSNSACVFNSRKLHCTTNWPATEKEKSTIICHFSTKSSYNY